MADDLYELPDLARLYDPLDPDRSDLDVYAALVAGLGASRVLDIGCGTGTFAVLLAGQGVDVVGLDPAAASLDVARAKPLAERVRWVHGTTRDLAVLEEPVGPVDAATMTANVAQAIVADDEWAATLAGSHAVLRPGGHLVLETRDPAYRAWEGWNPTDSHAVTRVEGVGDVETWHEVDDVSLPLVTFTWHVVLRGVRHTSQSTLRFREREEVVADLTTAGYAAPQLRDAPDRPGRELVFVARRPAG